MTHVSDAAKDIFVTAPSEKIMRAWFERRYLNVLGSIYIYNEHRGYTAIDRVIESVKRRSPNDRLFIARLERHRADERKHYLMFRRWFGRRGVMPFMVDRTFGHIDRFVEIMFRTPIARLRTQQVVESDELFARLCRVIALTERRGYRQVQSLLSNPIVQSDPVLTRIFTIIRKDEPGHWAPYEEWLSAHEQRSARWWERCIDYFVHAELLLFKLPFLFLNPFVKPCTVWADEADRKVDFAHSASATG
ncbi:ferritin-like domain-containing protein [Sphingobium sp. AN558]|uniref:ferritin-like domain-containing protein n=1 Tax=Sphingobium sp. AN558 TaxID=3133442 RepID=UPI0030C0140C